MMSKKNLIEKVMNEPQPLPRRVPDYMRKKGGSWYWTGSLIMTVFFYELITGVLLLLYYQPSNAYSSTEAMLNIPYGSIILTTHLYGAYIMIALVYVHLLRNLFIGSFKKPRESQWLTGVLLLVLTVAVAYFGYSMTGDVLSADATDVGRGIAQAFPVIGSYLSGIFFGTGTAITLFSRLEGWHIIIAGSILALFAVHFFMSEYNTIMPSPKKSGYRVPLIDEESPDYKPWYPHNLVYMVELSLFVLSLVFIIPSVLSLMPGVPPLFSPYPQVSASSPLASSVPPYPPWFLLFVYKELDFGISSSLGPFWSVLFFTGLPLVYLLLVPYIDTKQTMKISRRPVIIYTGILGILYYIGLSAWGALMPGIHVSNVVGFLFFLIPALIIIPITYFVVHKIERGESALGENLWKIYAILPVVGFLSILSGIIGFRTVTTSNSIYLIPFIVLLVLLAISILFTLGWTYGIKYSNRQIRLNGRQYIIFGGIYGFLAIAIIAIISIISPISIDGQALYGVGIGLLFLLGGAFIKLYRSHEYQE